MNYIGRKYSLLEFLKQGIRETVGGRARVFFDVFAGTGTVGWFFKQQGFRIVANDIQYYGYCLNRALVGISRQPGFSQVPGEKSLKGVLARLNDLPGKDGFVFQTYCSGGGRMYFSDENGQRCDAVRQRIEAWRRAGRLSEGEYFYLLASLIDAMDRVANTASVYAAHLKHLKKTAQKAVRLEPLPVVSGGGFRHRVHNQDGAALVGRVPCDILYMDPPYNQRQYCTNYHVLETIARYDDPTVFGQTGLREYDGQRSDFCLRRKALPALETMVRKARARYVFLSYNSEGLMKKDEIIETMKVFGKVKLNTLDYARFRADTDRENRVYKADRVEEYLFCLTKH
ncbi:MAG: DNA adenine methylase [bacterium]|nr:DNA adenine methylase [bacterium]